MVVEFSLERYKEKRYFNILLENNVSGNNMIEIVHFHYIGDNNIGDDFTMFYGFISMRGSHIITPIRWNQYGEAIYVGYNLYLVNDFNLLMEDYNRTEMVK